MQMHQDIDHIGRFVAFTGFFHEYGSDHPAHLPPDNRRGNMFLLCSR